MSEQIVDLVEAVMPGPRGGVTPELEQLHDDTQKLHDQTQALTATTQKLQDEAVNTLITTDSKSYSSLFSQTSRVFDTVADMTSAPLLFDGMTCRTLGFYEVGDGGGAEYVVREPQGGESFNDFDFLRIRDASYGAKLVSPPGYYNFRQLGAKAYGNGMSYDDIPDDVICCDDVLDYLASTVVANKLVDNSLFIPNGRYFFRQSHKITSDYKMSIFGTPIRDMSSDQNNVARLDYLGDGVFINTNGVNYSGICFASDSYECAVDRSLITSSTPEEWFKETVKRDGVTLVKCSGFGSSFDDCVFTGASKTALEQAMYGSVTNCYFSMDAEGLYLGTDCNVSDTHVSSCGRGITCFGGNSITNMRVEDIKGIGCYIGAGWNVSQGLVVDYTGKENINISTNDSSAHVDLKVLCGRAYVTSNMDHKDPTDEDISSMKEGAPNSNRTVIRISNGNTDATDRAFIRISGRLDCYADLTDTNDGKNYVSAIPVTFSGNYDHSGATNAYRLELNTISSNFNYVGWDGQESTKDDAVSQIRKLVFFPYNGKWHDSTKTVVINGLKHTNAISIGNEVADNVLLKDRLRFLY